VPLVSRCFECLLHDCGTRRCPFLPTRWLAPLFGLVLLMPTSPAAAQFQPVRVELPDAGNVTFFDTSSNRQLSIPTPAQTVLAVGHTYRLKISHMPEFPGIELFPSLELVDQLHPPAGRQDEFPIPVELTRYEIQLAIQGRFVTKVIYLEQPQLAVPLPEKVLTPLTMAPNRNLLAEADRRGRPMLIVRLGGRLPSGQGSDEAFYGTGAPIMVSQPNPNK